MSQEWNSKFNPFNSDKLFATADRWKLIQRGKPLPPPRSVSIDPMNLCDEKCIFCFVGNTKIKTPNGYKEIKNIKGSDEIITFNEKSKKIQVGKVKKTYKRTTKKLIILSWGDVLGKKKIITTYDHPFYVKGKWIKARNLKVGGFLYHFNGKEVEIKDFQYYFKERDVYNFTCENNTYFAENILVHNCNAEFVLDENKGSRLEEDVMYAIPDFLKSWDDGKYKVESVCVGGGGESLLNKHTGQLIDRLYERGIGVGIVTNGTHIDYNLESLAKCTWVGVSINAATREIYNKIHVKDEFDHVLSNVRELVKYSKANKTELAKPGHGHGISFKYLLHPYNVHEVIQATKIAKEIGCRNMHIRPVCVPWFFLNKGQSPYAFKPEHVETFTREIAEAMKLEDENFGVYGVTHKFNPDFTPRHDFESCYAIFMTGVIMPPSDRNKGTGKLDFGSCCDLRGNDLLTQKNLISLKQIKGFWGSEAHWKMHDAIKVRDCPRCTFSGANKIYQEAIKINNMSYDFI